MSDYINLIAPHIAYGLVSAGAVYLGLKLVQNPNDSPNLIEVIPDLPSGIQKRLRRILLYQIICVSSAATTGAVTVLFRDSLDWKQLNSSLLPLVIVMATGIMSEVIPYPRTRSVGVKHAVWLLHSSCMGLLVAPSLLQHYIQSPSDLPLILVSQSVLLAFVSLLSITIPNDRYRQVGCLTIGALSVIVTSSLVGKFIYDGSILGRNLWIISSYGGIICFSVSFLFDVQLAVSRAAMCNFEDHDCFDPINSSSRILMDLVHLFIRISSLF